ncbi:hypothetical protein ARTHRO9AX_20194 [Arthrobacter sp. 9AX]|nr:hypothetical protein ARTHRO9AX_20194 [Arthrobacter sp. 9AX]
MARAERGTRDGIRRGDRNPGESHGLMQTRFVRQNNDVCITWARPEAGSVPCLRLKYGQAWAAFGVADDGGTRHCVRPRPGRGSLPGHRPGHCPIGHHRSGLRAAGG